MAQIHPPRLFRVLALLPEVGSDLEEVSLLAVVVGLDDVAVSVVLREE
jgi:hypothetical protein